VFAGGNSNDAWFFNALVLRVCWRADRTRLLREAALLVELPDEIPHPEVLAHGQTADMSWVLSPRCAGVPLVQLLRELEPGEVRRLMGDTAEIVRALHRWQPPPELRALLADRPGLDLKDPMTAWAADLVPLPLPRTLDAIVPLAKQVPGIDPGIVDEAARQVRSLAAHDPFKESDENHLVVVHGDATAANFLVDGGRITALIDFEHTRMAPPDLELLSPVLYGSGFGLAQWRTTYPELFEQADLRQRVWLAELCAALRGLIWWPPLSNSSASDGPHPPVATLRRLIQSPTFW
jgi:aminoglycoside phosphotransferase (APT) family kinase protein